MTKKININNLTFNIGFCLEFISYFLSTVVFKDNFMNRFISVIHYISFLVLFAAILINSKHQKRKFISFIFAVIFGILNFYITNNTTIITLVLAVYAARTIEFNKLVKSVLVLRISLLILTIGLTTIGVTINYVDPRTDIYKASLGFTHPNVLGMHLFAIMIYIIYLYRDLSLKKIVLFGSSVYLLCFIAGARTSILSIMVTFLLLAIVRITKVDAIKNKLSFLVLKNSYLIGLFISVFMGVLYSSNILLLLLLDVVLSRRLYFFNYYLSNYSITLFGQPVHIQEQNWDYSTNSLIPLLTLDNAYLYYLISGGIIGTVILYIYFKKSINNMLLAKDVVGIVCFISFLVSGLSEINTMDINYNLFLLLALNEKNTESHTH